MTGPAPVGAIYRVNWVPGTDRLVGTCHCGATAEADDPCGSGHGCWLTPLIPPGPARDPRPPTP